LEASEIMVGGRPAPKAPTGVLIFPTKSHLKTESEVIAITAMKETPSFDEVIRRYEAGEIDTRQMMYLTEQIKFNRHPQLYVDTFTEEIGYANVEAGS
jgi:hypothetical protein